MPRDRCCGYPKEPVLMPNGGKGISLCSLILQIMILFFFSLDSTGSYSVAVSTSRIPCLRSETSGAIIKKEICHVQLQVMEKYEKLKIANDSHVGLELLHLFVLDLLGRDTPAAKIFTAKSSNE